MDAGAAALAGGVEEGFADAAEVARLDANENR